jgi:hypothetical protein
MDAHESRNFLAGLAKRLPAEVTVEDREGPVTREALLRVIRNDLLPVLVRNPLHRHPRRQLPALYGPVAAGLRQALVAYSSGRGEDFLPRLEQALEAAAAARKADDYDPATKYVTATSWAVSCTLGAHIDGAILNVHDLDHEAVNGHGGWGVVVWHPVHDKRQFPSQDAARAYALRMGLLQRFVPSRVLV